MQNSNLPAKFPIPFANNAGSSYIRPIPQASQGSQSGAASLYDGFPPICFVPTTANGIPPSGQDINGILNQLSAWARWQAAGGTVPFDQTFANAIGGYPYGAIVQSTTTGKLWFNVADGNTTNPDGNAAQNWITFGGAVSGSGSLAGQCQLTYIGPTEVRLMPVGSGRVFHNGAWVTLPSTGVPISNTGLSGVDFGAATLPALNFNYMYLTGTSTFSLEPSTTGHMADLTNGQQIKAGGSGGDPSRTLVGMLALDATGGQTPVFANSVTRRLVASYFNRVGRDLRGPRQSTTPTGVYTGSSAATEYGVAQRLAALTWGDRLTMLSYSGWASSFSGFVGDYFRLYLDGAEMPVDMYNSFQSSGYSISAGTAPPWVMTEGLHVTSPYIFVSGGSSYFQLQNFMGVES